MREYEVTITETLEMTVAVEAESREEAQQIASDNWKNGDYMVAGALRYLRRRRRNRDRGSVAGRQCRRSALLVVVWLQLSCGMVRLLCFVVCE